jgi:hypothetical protein
MRTMVMLGIDRDQVVERVFDRLCGLSGCLL